MKISEINTMNNSSYLMVLFCTIAGKNGEELGIDEEQNLIVLFVDLLYDVPNNKMYIHSRDEDRELVTMPCPDASGGIERTYFPEYVMIVVSVLMMVLMMVIGTCIFVLQRRIGRSEAMYEAKLALYERIMTSLHRELAMVIARQERQHHETRTADQERHHLRDRIANLEQEMPLLRDRIINLEQEMPLLRNRLADTETTNRQQDITICRLYSRIRAH